MFSDEVRSLIMEVLTSWQVIFITVALIAYLSLVFYVVRYKKREIPAIPKPKKEKKPKPPKPAAKKEEDDDDEDMER